MIKPIYPENKTSLEEIWAVGLADLFIKGDCEEVARHLEMLAELARRTIPPDKSGTSDTMHNIMDKLNSYPKGEAPIDLRIAVLGAVLNSMLCFMAGFSYSYTIHHPGVETEEKNERNES